MTRSVVVGTAGHIDHGKTALVRALTGIDTDRLAEEKRRGITIDLGFAHLALPDGTSAGIVDVPGHEDFIRNMVAGAAGIDVALLVVAADEGVMPQTREHLGILRMLDVPAAVVALTKCDLVDPDWLALAGDDVRAHLADSPWPDAPILPVSSRTGAGLEDLRGALARAAATGARERGIGLFRMPIDRAFTVHGTGTVVTGTVRDGCAQVGDELRVLPADQSARVRALQQHGDAVTQVAPGMRAAVALSGLDRDHAGRGSWLVSAPWPLSSALTVRLQLLRESEWEVRSRQRVRLHIGTAEIMARVVLLDAARLAAGDTGLAQLRLESPVVARYGDRFVLRSYSPVTTIGGGRVLESIAPKRKRIDLAGRERLLALESDPAGALPWVIADSGLDGVAESELPFRFGLATAADPALVRVAGRLYGRDTLSAAAGVVLDAVDASHRLHPLRPGLDRAEARRRIEGASPALADAVLDGLLAEGALRSVGGLLARPDFLPTQTEEQAAARSELERRFREAALAPPRADELPEHLRKRADLRDLLALLERDGTLVPYPPDRWIHRVPLEEARQRLAVVAERGSMTPGDFRELFDLPRKHLIPLLETFDRNGWTRREGDFRRVVHARLEVAQPTTGDRGS